jgi:hypothetical protein
VTHKVVAHYIGGRVVKGVSHDINPKRPFCHIRTTDQGTISVKLTDLKALFFVKDLTGDAKRNEGKTLATEDPRARGAVPIEVEFGDGERVVGLTSGYPPQSTFFFVWPVDPRSNNTRILVNQAAVARMAGGREQLPTPPRA